MSDARACLLKVASLNASESGRVLSARLNGTGWQDSRQALEGQDLLHFEEWEFGQDSWVFALVLDGHGGAGENNAAAEFVLAELPSLVKNALSSTLTEAGTTALEDAKIEQLLSDILVGLDDRIKHDVLAVLSDHTSEQLATDRDTILSRATSGTTVCVALVNPSRRVHVAHIGDSDCYLVSSKMQQFQHLTPRHQCSDPGERERIIREHPNEPAEDFLTGPTGKRLLGNLVLSRAIGDFDLKLPAAEVKQLLDWMGLPAPRPAADPMRNRTPPYLSNRPQFHHVQAKEGDFIVLASDGLADQVWWLNNQDSGPDAVGRVCIAGVTGELYPGYNTALEVLWHGWRGVVDTHLFRLVVDGESPSGSVDDIAIVVLCM